MTATFQPNLERREMLIAALHSNEEQSCHVMNRKRIRFFHKNSRKTTVESAVHAAERMWSGYGLILGESTICCRLCLN